MRLDKLTTKFQEALAEAQSLALGNDHAYIEPEHLLVAMLRQEDGPTALLQRAGVNVPGLQAAAESAMHRRPQVQGQEQVQVGRELVTLLQAAEKEGLKRGDQFIASELFLLALADTSWTSAASPARTASPASRSRRRWTPCAAARTWPARKRKPSARR